MCISVYFLCLFFFSLKGGHYILLDFSKKITIRFLVMMSPNMHSLCAFIFSYLVFTYYMTMIFHRNNIIFLYFFLQIRQNLDFLVFCLFCRNSWFDEALFSNTFTVFFSSFFFQSNDNHCLFLRKSINRQTMLLITVTAYQLKCKVSYFLFLIYFF